MNQQSSIGEREWLSAYKAANRDLLTQDPDFECWLENEYAPIAGGWQY